MDLTSLSLYEREDLIAGDDLASLLQNNLQNAAANLIKQTRRQKSISYVALLTWNGTQIVTRPYKLVHFIKDDE